MSGKRAIKKGDLVKILTLSRLDECIDYVATVLQCRYKVDAYLILPANSPFTTAPYWLAGTNLKVLGGHSR